MPCLRVIATLLLAASTALGHRRTTWTDKKAGLTVEGLGWRGEGLYHAAFTDGGVARVEFVPGDQIIVNETTASMPVVEFDTQSNLRAGKKLGGITCGLKGFRCRTLWQSDMAMMKLREYFGEGKNVNKEWFWYDSGRNHIAYVCSYTNNHITWGLIDKYWASINAVCGDLLYGFRRGITYDAKDAAVGRAQRGEPFCKKNFVGVE